MVVYNDLVYNKHNQKLDIYLPENSIETIFIYFHGGSLEGGSKSCANIFAEYLCNNNVSVVSVDYRVYPDAKFPDFINDCSDAVAWVFQNKNLFKECDRVFIGGSSAGGYISMMLCFDNKYLNSVNIKNTDIAGYIHDSGQPTSHFNVLSEAGINSKRVIVDETSPLYFIGLEKQYPPMLFIVSDNDIPARLEQTQLLLATMKSFGYNDFKIEYMLMHGSHCEYVEKTDENGKPVFGEIIFNYIKGEL